MGRRTQRGRIFSARRRLSSDERGVALVEFTLVLPLILLLLLGMIDFGKAFNYWNDETHLANEAVRQAVVDNCPSCAPGQKINDWIRTEADTGELMNGGTQSISSPGLRVCIWFTNNTVHSDVPDVQDHAVGDPVQAIVHAQYNWLAYLVGQGLPFHSDLTGTATMRLETTYKADGSDAFTTGPATAPKTDASGTC
jgi:Flp pilus assembly protein TadG